MSGISPEYNTRNYDPLKNAKVTPPPIIDKAKIQIDNSRFYWYGWIYFAITIILIIGLALFVVFHFIDNLLNSGLWIAALCWVGFIFLSGFIAASFRTDYYRTKAILENKNYDN